ncbi:hypothetical protein Hanom_Chr05g00416441 [Helianthus anomalus]
MREIPSIFEIGGLSRLATANPFIERFRAGGFPMPPELETGGLSQPTLEERIGSIEMHLHMFMRRIDRELDVIRQRRINDA